MILFCSRLIRPRTVSCRYSRRSKQKLVWLRSDVISCRSTLRRFSRERGTLVERMRLEMRRCLSTTFSRTTMVFSCIWEMSMRSSWSMSSWSLICLAYWEISLDRSSIISASRSTRWSRMLANTLKPEGYCRGFTCRRRCSSVNERRGTSRSVARVSSTMVNDTGCIMYSSCPGVRKLVLAKMASSVSK